MRGRSRHSWWLAASLAVTGLGATSVDTRLVESVKNRDFATAAVLMKTRRDVNVALPDGTTALHWAVRWNSLDTVETLLRAGADVNATSRYKITPLALACENGNAAMVERLLKAGADPNASPKGDTPLMVAARTGDVETVAVLLAHGATVNTKEPERGQTALMWAVAEAHPAVAKVLVENGANVDARSTGGFTPLLFAVRKGDAATLRLLLAAGANPNEKAPDKEQSPLLFVAIENGHYDLVNLLVDKGASLDSADKSGRTALHALILARNPEDEYATPLTQTGILETAKLMKALLARGANPNVRANLSALTINGEDAKKEKEEGQAEKAQKPKGVGIDRRVGSQLDVDRVQRNGVTPFWLAAQKADAEVMRILAAGGADPLLPSSGGSTPLMAAAGITAPNLGGDARRLPPPAAVIETVQLAVELGNKVDVPGAHGQTALHAAVYGGGLEGVIQFLITQGANVDAKNERGQTPFDLAQEFLAEHPNHDVAASLLKKGAQGGGR
jgi:ankyrin repeat protein